MNIILSKEELLEYLKQTYKEGFVDGVRILDFSAIPYSWEQSDAIGIPDEIREVIK